MVPEWIGFVVGAALLGATVASVVGTLVVPRGVDSRISRSSDGVVDAAFQFVIARVSGVRRQEAALAWQGPVTLLARLSVWIVPLWAGFALVLLPFAGPAAFSEAGSSIFTLGYAPPTDVITTAIDYVAAFTGVIVVGLQVGYLPTIYAVFNRRETEVTMLTARAGVPPDASISVTRAESGEAVTMLRGIGYPIERTDDEAWSHFRGWRVNYDLAALAIARAVDAPPALWTGPRRYPSAPIPPLRPANRTPRPPVT